MRRLDWQRPEYLIPLLLILAGVLLLLNNLGLPVCAVLWPLLLVGLGVWIIATRVSMPVGMGVRDLSLPLGTARRVTLDLASGVGNLRLGALGRQDRLAEGRFELAIDARYEESAGEGYLHLRRSAAWWFPFWGWIVGDQRLALSPAVSWRIHGRWLIGDLRLDLSELPLAGLDLISTVGDADIAFPAQGHIVARLGSTLGDLHLQIPEAMAARIRFTGSLLGDRSIDRRFETRQSGYEYATPGFETAENRLDLEIGSHVGQIRIT